MGSISGVEPGCASRIYKFVVVGNHSSFCGWFDHFDWLHQLCLDLCLWITVNLPKTCPVEPLASFLRCPVKKKTRLNWWAKFLHFGGSKCEILRRNDRMTSQGSLLFEGRHGPGRFWKWLGIAWNGCPVGQEARRHRRWQIGRFLDLGWVFFGNLATRGCL